MKRTGIFSYLILILALTCFSKVEVRAQQSAQAFYLNLNNSKEINSLQLGFIFCNFTKSSDSATLLLPELSRFRMSLLSVDYLSKDIYNNGESNFSYLPNLITDAWLFLVYGLSTEKAKQSNNGLLPKLAVLPTILLNSETQFRLFEITDNIETYLDPALYIKTHLNWFTQNKTDYFQYRPEFGLNLLYSHNNGGSSSGLSIAVGAAYPIDFVPRDTKTHGFELSLTACYSLGDYMGTQMVLQEPEFFEGDETFEYNQIK